MEQGETYQFGDKFQNGIVVKYYIIKNRWWEREHIIIVLPDSEEGYDKDYGVAYIETQIYQLKDNNWIKIG